MNEYTSEEKPRLIQGCLKTNPVSPIDEIQCSKSAKVKKRRWQTEDVGKTKFSVPLRFFCLDNWVMIIIVFVTKMAVCTVNIFKVDFFNV